ncbi:FecR family protein [Maribellus sediminis]|uniref:FecR family protein n=1 Tax=Maribellus sediminis TaxID=2696285 RepID=UPI00142FAC32|nr:FecR domain-containing protein [Maribellus sediminis]
MERYIEDKRFVKWVFLPDTEVKHYYAKYFRKHPEEKEEMVKLRDQLRCLEFSNKSYATELPENIFRKIQADIIELESSKKSQIRILSVLKYAAIAVLLLSTGFFANFFAGGNSSGHQFSEDLLLIGTMVEPRLYLSDGSSVIVPGPDYEVSYAQANKIIVGHDTIEVNRLKKNDRGKDALVVSYGRKVKLVLPDHSEVWVNSGSRLIFSHNFESKIREVFLSGEGYFDVEKNPEQPFYVRTTAMAVKVLGTEFNVSAYPENETIEAVLEKGSVQIEENDRMWFGKKAVLVPNQRASFDKQTHEIKIAEVEHENYTLWKEGLVTIDDETLDDVFGKIERYFNIDIKIADREKIDMQISGKLDFNVGRERVFEYIEKLTDGKFTEIGPAKYKFE